MWESEETKPKYKHLEIKESFVFGMFILKKSLWLQKESLKSNYIWQTILIC